MTRAVAYLRTSSAANVGDDKDSATRQRLAIQTYAASAGIEIVGEFYDAAISGADRIDARPGFQAMLSALGGLDADMIVVENASRFARDLIVQETGYRMLRDYDIALIASDDPEAFTSDTPTAVMVRQILGAVSQFEKTNLVLKLRGARERKRAATGRCEGRKPASEGARNAARALRLQGHSLRLIASQLAAMGYTAPSGAVYGAESVKSMLRAA